MPPPVTVSIGMRCRVLGPDVSLKALVDPQAAVAALRGLLVLPLEELVAPPRHRVPFRGGDLVLTVGGSNRAEEGCCGARIYHSGTGSPDALDQVVCLFDLRGRLQLVCIGSELGELRTGLLGALAVEFCAPPTAAHLGIIGTGRQARAQLWALARTKTFREISIFSRNEKNREAFAATMGEELKREIVVAASADEVAAASDVLVTATSSAVPVFHAEALKPEVHINHVGPKLAGRSELSRTVYDSATLLTTDAPAQAAALGKTFMLHGRPAYTRIRPLSDLARQGRPAEAPARSIFISLGLAGTETILARHLYERLAGRDDIGYTLGDSC